LKRPSKKTPVKNQEKSINREKFDQNSGLRNVNESCEDKNTSPRQKEKNTAHNTNKTDKRKTEMHRNNFGELSIEVK
jgi:hypothetical protein